MALGELQASAAADLVDAFRKRVFLDVAGGVHVDDYVGLAAGVQEDVGGTVVVHAAVDEVDAWGVFQTGRTAGAFGDGSVLEHEIARSMIREGISWSSELRCSYCSLQACRGW